MDKGSRYLRASKNSGFSLLDLTVVMLLISTFAAFLTAATNSTSDKELDARCREHLRQLGAASTMYMNDFDGNLWHFDGPNQLHYWSRQLVRSNHAPGGPGRGSPIFWCPAYISSEDQMRREGPNATFWPYTTYAFNATNADDGPEASRVTEPGVGIHFFVNSKKMRDPANYWLLTEAVSADNDRSVSLLRHDSGRRGDHLWNAAARDGTGIHLRHEGFANMSFFDGHVESAGPERLLSVGPVEFRQGWVGRYEVREF